MSEKKRWWELFEESKKQPSVVDFMDTMKAFGAAGGPHVDCFVYFKDDIVLVANYRAVDGAMVGSVMTQDVYEEMMCDRKETLSTLPLGYFAWAHRYGFDYLSRGMDAVTAFKYAVNQGAVAEMDMSGNHYDNVMYLVREYINAKIKGEYGVNDEFNLVGIFADIHEAEKVAKDVLAEDGYINEHDVTIIPVVLNRKYDNRPNLGGSWYIE